MATQLPDGLPEGAVPATVVGFNDDPMPAINERLADALYAAWNKRTSIQYRRNFWDEIVGDVQVQRLIQELMQ